MIRQLMKRDPAWRWAPILTLASGAFCALWHFLPAGAKRDSSLYFFTVFIALPLSAAYLAATQRAETRFLAALPVTVRQVYLARVLSTLGLLWLPAAASVAIALVLPNPAAPVATLVQLLSVLTLAMVGVQSAGIHRFTMSFTVPKLVNAVSFFLWMLGASLAPTFGWLSGENRTGYVFLMLICGLASAAIFLRTWHTVPESFQTASLKASPVAVISAAAPSRFTALNKMPAPPWIAFLRSVLRWGGLEIIYLFVLMLSGPVRMFVCFLVAGAWPNARPRVRWLFALPLHPRVLLSAILLPIILTIAGGYLIGIHLPSFPAFYGKGISVWASQELPQWSHYRREPNCRTLNVLPSLDFWVPANEGKAPLIQAPWGETFQPPAFYKSGFDIFNPYAVGCTNSERFLDWQFNRATIAVYGRPIPRKKDEGEYEIDSYVVVRSPRTQFVTVAAITGFAMLIMIVTMLNDWHRFRRLAGPVRVTILSLVSAAGFTLLMLDIGDKFVLTQWVSWTLPPKLSGVIAVVIPSLAILWWVLDILFRQVEIVDKPEPSTT